MNPIEVCAKCEHIRKTPLYAMCGISGSSVASYEDFWWYWTFPRIPKECPYQLDHIMIDETRKFDDVQPTRIRTLPVSK